MTKIAIKIRPDVAFAASGRIFFVCRDVANVTSGRNFSRVVVCF